MKSVKGLSVWITLAAIFFVSINLRPSVTSVGPLLNTITEELGITNTQVSLLTSIPVFCMGLFAPFAVALQRKLGSKWAINLLLLAIGIVTAARLLINDYFSLLLTSFIAGVAIAIISPLINAFIKERFSHKIEPVIGLYSLAMGAGATISAGFTGLIFERSHSWQTALGVWGLLAIPAVILWMIASGGKKKVSDPMQSVGQGRNPWKNKTAWLILFYFGLQTSVFFSLTTWLSPIAQEQGFSLIKAGSVLTTMSVVQMFGNIFIPILINKFPNRIMWLYILLTIGLIGAAILLIDVQWSIWIGAVILGVSLSGLFPIGLMLPLDEAKNNAEAGSWSSMVLSGGFMMSAIVPLLIGFVYDETGSHAYSKGIIIGLFIAMFVAVYLLQQQKRHV
ncbi:MFS transporter [Lysinibacillus sp. 54212]|uniref:MFS transporter n=1 Tax=Lysinibacillus sp. 54212 TaxID=3119829 RepID=UPI002FC6D378